MAEIDNPKEPLARAAYEALADSYDARVSTKPHNAFYDRPAVLSLLPDLEGKRVLEAGCGPGVYLEEIINRGAEHPVGIDVSPKMIAHARHRLGDRATLQVMNLEKGLSAFADGCFDLVLSPLVPDYIKDWRALFREFHRVLSLEGCFIFSSEHPSSDYRRRMAENYFTTAKTELEWKGFDQPVVVPSYRRPLQEMINPLIEEGFTLDKVLEPQPTEDFKRADEREYRHLSQNPGFICFRAVKKKD